MRVGVMYVFGDVGDRSGLHSFAYCSNGGGFEELLVTGCALHTQDAV
jgi:hypothetical protein